MRCDARRCGSIWSDNDIIGARKLFCRFRLSSSRFLLLFVGCGLPLQVYVNPFWFYVELISIATATKERNYRNYIVLRVCCCWRNDHNNINASHQSNANSKLLHSQLVSTCDWIRMFEFVTATLWSTTGRRWLSPHPCSMFLFKLNGKLEQQSTDRRIHNCNHTRRNSCTTTTTTATTSTEVGIVIYCFAFESPFFGRRNPQQIHTAK